MAHHFTDNQTFIEPIASSNSEHNPRSS